MSIYKDRVAIQRCLDFVETAELLSEPNEWVNLPTNYAVLSRGLPYREYWELHKRNFWFHIKLIDESIILFEDDSFRFIMSPISTPTLDEYFEIEFGDEWSDLDEGEKEKYIISGCFNDSYNSYVESVSDYKSFTPVRLDQHPNQYKPTHHPVHHLHIGYENESRIPVKRVLNPLAFTAFIISTFYPNKWERLHDIGYINEETITSYKEKLGMVGHINQGHWHSDWEEKRLYLV